MNSPQIAVYPGSFDPLHNGHLDIIKRCCPLFDEVIVAVLGNETKDALFTVAERVGIIRSEIDDLEGCRVEGFSGLLVDFMDREGARIIVRGHERNGRAKEVSVVSPAKATIRRKEQQRMSLGVGVYPQQGVVDGGARRRHLSHQLGDFLGVRLGLGSAGQGFLKPGRRDQLHRARDLLDAFDALAP